MRWPCVLLTVVLGLACGAREPPAPNVCLRLRPDEPSADGYDEVKASIERELLGITRFDVRCGGAAHPLRFESGPYEPIRFAPRGRCRDVLVGDDYGTLAALDGASKYGDEVIWAVRGTDDGTFTAELTSIPLGIHLSYAGGRWTGKGTACDGRPPVCAALRDGSCTITATRLTR